MQPYENVGSDSGVTAYEIEPRGLRVQFKDGWVYRYTYESIGTANVEHMKKLAQAGEGLGTFINRSAKMGYESKVR